MYWQQDCKRIMLNGDASIIRIEGTNTISRAVHCAHLIASSLPGHLAAATCIYFDGVREDVSYLGMLDFVEEWFSAFKSKPKVVLVRTNQKQAPRSTIGSLRLAASTNNTAFRRSFATLQFFPKGRKTIDDTWRPSVYCAISVANPASAFFCVNANLDLSQLRTLLLQGDALFRSCASYGFWFPARFSPLAYYWGLVVEPAAPKDVAWGKRELKRLSHWRDNTSIGVVTDGERRVVSACDGFVRDAYPLMLVNDKHMNRSADGITLLERIRKDNVGEVDPIDRKQLWHIPPEKLTAAQLLLDDNDITLSGRRFEDMRYGSIAI